MKGLTFALAFLLSVPAMAQFGGMGRPPATQAKSIETELLEMEQEADKTALKEALSLQARRGMKPRNERQEHAAALRGFIANE